MPGGHRARRLDVFRLGHRRPAGLRARRRPGHRLAVASAAAGSRLPESCSCGEVAWPGGARVGGVDRRLAKPSGWLPGGHRTGLVARRVRRPRRSAGDQRHDGGAARRCATAHRDRHELPQSRAAPTGYASAWSTCQPPADEALGLVRPVRRFVRSTVCCSPSGRPGGRRDDPRAVHLHRGFPPRRRVQPPATVGVPRWTAIILAADASRIARQRPPGAQGSCRRARRGPGTARRARARPLRAGHHRVRAMATIAVYRNDAKRTLPPTSSWSTGRPSLSTLQPLPQPLRPGPAVLSKLESKTPSRCATRRRPPAGEMVARIEREIDEYFVELARTAASSASSSPSWPAGG